MDGELIDRIEQIMGARPVRWRAMAGRTRAGRWVVEFGDGSSAFVKAATDAATASWLRAEERIFRQVRGTFMPAFLGWQEGERPVLVMEDLRRCSLAASVGSGDGRGRLLGSGGGVALAAAAGAAGAGGGAGGADELAPGGGGAGGVPVARALHVGVA